MLPVTVSAAIQVFPSPKDWRDLTMYLIFTDRFADGDLANNELTPGARWRPNDPRGIHGGDFKGIEEHLDYIQALGARALWITPVFLNEPSSAWHGYGAIDFSVISPQLGGLRGLQSLTQAAHRRGLYLILDVVVNHLGNVATSDDPGWPRFRAEGEGYHLRWTSPSRIPSPPFNQLSWFHDRGRVQNWFDPVQAVVGQFFTLNDLRTELPEVRSALVKAYEELIRATDCDGFRVDTVRHVEQSFWVPWCSAMREYAASLGKTNFFLFGEVALGDDQALARFTGPSGAPARAFDSLID
jgi:glycosidase